MGVTDCILWPEDHVQRNGYGWVSVDGKRHLAHRWVMGEPDGQVGHLCHDRAAAAGECTGGFTCLHRRCVNPEHLAVQTARENNSSSANNPVHRKFDTHCKNGHEFTPENTLWENRGKGYRCRKCRICANRRQRERKARLRAAMS